MELELDKEWTAKNLRRLLERYAGDVLENDDGTWTPVSMVLGDAIMILEQEIENHDCN